MMRAVMKKKTMMKRKKQSMKPGRRKRVNRVVISTSTLKRERTKNLTLMSLYQTKKKMIAMKMV